jgi:hypothetical protein
VILYLQKSLKCHQAGICARLGEYQHVVLTTSRGAWQYCSKVFSGKKLASIWELQTRLYTLRKKVWCYANRLSLQLTIRQTQSWL